MGFFRHQSQKGVGVFPGAADSLIQSESLKEQEMPTQRVCHYWGWGGAVCFCFQSAVGPFTPGWDMRPETSIVEEETFLREPVS